MNIDNYNKLSCSNNGYFYLLFCEDRNVTKNKDLAEVLEIKEEELLMFLKVNGCKKCGEDYVVTDGQNIDDIFNKLKDIFR